MADTRVVVVDSGYLREQLAACYLVIDSGEVALVDCGVNASLGRIEAALSAQGLGFDALRWVIPTHVHLDHAGGAGAVMQACEHARLVVHERGARHLIDPSRLTQGVVAVYGQARFDQWYGRLLPVDAARVDAVSDQCCLRLGASDLLVFDAPGHASHHVAVWDQFSGSLFAGDCFGLSYREFDVGGRACVLPTTTPVQFKPALWEASLRRFEALGARRIGLTHFGFVEDLPLLFAQLRSGLADYQRTARDCAGEQDRYGCVYARLLALAKDLLESHGCDLEALDWQALLALDLELNAKGLLAWLDRIGRQG